MIQDINISNVHDEQGFLSILKEADPYLLINTNGELKKRYEKFIEELNKVFSRYFHRYIILLIDFFMKSRKSKKKDGFI